MTSEQLNDLDCLLSEYRQTFKGKVPEQHLYDLQCEIESRIGDALEEEERAEKIAKHYRDIEDAEAYAEDQHMAKLRGE